MSHMRILKRRMKLNIKFHTGGTARCGRDVVFDVPFFFKIVRILTYENCNIFDIFTGANFNFSMSVNEFFIRNFSV